MAKAVGVSPNQVINLHDYRVLRPLIVAIIAHENAGYRYPADVIDEGLRLAGVPKPKASAAQLATATALTAGGTAAAIEGVNELLPLLNLVNQVSYATDGLPSLGRAIAYLGVAISVGASLYAFWRLRRAQKAVQA